MSWQDPAKIFDDYYFAHGCGQPYQRDEVWLGLFDSIAEHIVGEMQPKTVLDAGCAMGFLVEGLRKRGVEAFGMDISAYAIQNVHPSIQAYCWVGSAHEPFPQKYDLIVSIEVLEHLSQAQAKKAVINFCLHSDDILFSSTPLDYKEASHFNVQPPEYWAELFARQGFYRDVDFDAAFITPWAARFRKKNEPIHRLVREYERKYWFLWKENADLRSLTLEMREQLSQGEKRSLYMEKQLAEKEPDVQRLAEILSSSSWRFVVKAQNLRRRLIPEGSSRERLLFALIGKEK